MNGQRTSQALKRAQAIEDELLQLWLAGGSTAAIAELLAQRAGNPVAVADEFFNLVASSPKTEHGDPFRAEAIRRGGTASEVREDPIVGAEYRRVAEERVPRIIPLYPEHGMLMRRLMGPVLAGNDLLGFVTLLESSRPLQEGDAVLLQRAGLILAVDFLHQRAVLEAEMRLRADFLRDLFTQEDSSAKAIGLRASMLGIALFRPWDLMVVEPDDSAVTVGDADSLITSRAWLSEAVRTVRGIALAMFKDSVTIAQGDAIVVLRPVVPQSASEEGTRRLADAIRSDVSRLLGQSIGTVSVGVGGRCEAVADFGRRYEEARRALHASRSLGLKDRTQTLDSLGIYGILGQPGNHEMLLGFALRVLEPLLEYDGRRHTELVETLDVYLDERCGLRRTARRLDVHPNTLRARLQRIEETGQLDLADAKVLLNLQLALEIYWLSHAESRRSHPRRPPAGTDPRLASADKHPT